MKKIVLWHGTFYPPFRSTIDNGTYQFFLNALSHRYGWVPEFRNVQSSCPNKDNLNLMIYPCENIDMLVNHISKLDVFTLIWCKINEVKIIFSFARECACGIMLDKILSAIKAHSELKNYISIVRVLINSFDNKHLNKHSDLFININSFDYIYREYAEILKLKTLSHEKKYKFSLFTGTLSHRIHRIKFLLDLKKCNLINSDLFYTIMCPEQTSKLDAYLKDNITPEEIELLNTLKIDSCVNADGDEMSSKKVYSSLQEWTLPKQMLQSHINIVLETCLQCPAITEKIYKPIIAGIPFVWLGHPHIANELQNQGYKLYPFINYEFDDIENADKRREALIFEINRLSFLNLQDKTVESEQTINYNIDKFISNTSFNRLENFIQKI